MFDKLKRLFKKDVVDEEDVYFDTDTSMLPDDFTTLEQMTTSEALEQVLHRLDIIEKKIDKL